jgi:hypothetical protein
VLIYLTETALSIPLSSRQATLHACLASTQSFLFCVFSVPTLEYYKVTYLTWIQLLHALDVLCNLSSYQSLDWDPTHVRGVIDVSLVIDGVIRKFEELQRLRQLPEKGPKKNTLLDTIISRLRQDKLGFEERSAMLVDMHELQSRDISDAPQQMEVQEMFSELDDSFWQEIITDWIA